jgi:hypothetical protein
LRFGVIWEGPTVEDEGTYIISDYRGDKNTSILKSMTLSSDQLGKMKRRIRYYPQDIYQTNFQKYPLVLVNHNIYVAMIEVFIKTHLKELQVKNREDRESNHRIVAVYNLQCYMYNVGKPIGGKQGEKSLIYDFIKNKYAYAIDDSTLCWFGCISYLIEPPKKGESVNMRMTKARECFYDFYDYSHLDEIEKKKKVEEYTRFMMVEEIDKFMSFFETDVNVFRYVEKDVSYEKQYSYIYLYIAKDNVCAECRNN